MAKNKFRFSKKRLIRKDKTKTVSILRRLLLFILLAFFGIFIYVWLNLAVTRSGYFLSAQEAERKRLEERNRELKLEVAKLKSLERLEEIARKELLLSEPKRKEIIWIDR